jgi:hypothetical protein
MVYPALLPLLCTPRLPVVDWTDAPADLNGLVRFAERRNLVSARVPSHFTRSLHDALQYHEQWAGAEARERIITERITTKKRCWCLPTSDINILKVVENLSRFYVTLRFTSTLAPSVYFKFSVPCIFYRFTNKSFQQMQLILSLFRFVSFHPTCFGPLLAHHQGCP